MNLAILWQIVESVPCIPRRSSQFLKRSSVVKRFTPMSYWRFTFLWRVRLESSVDFYAKSGEQVLTERLIPRSLIVNATSTS